MVNVYRRIRFELHLAEVMIYNQGGHIERILLLETNILTYPCLDYDEKLCNPR
jgi:hypothetical protein